MYRSGLIPNCAGYEIINIVETTGKENLKEKRWIITIRSTLINKWAGSMSVLDKDINERYFPSEYTMSLERDFMVYSNDFLNLFSASYVCSIRDKNRYYSSYHMLRVPPKSKNSIYLEMDIKREGWLDFCIKQFEGNMIEPKTNRSRLRIEEEGQAQGRETGKRYLKVKFMLAKEIDSHEEARGDNWKDFDPPQWEAYEVEYFHGYNRGDARFVDIAPGRYVLRIKA